MSVFQLTITVLAFVTALFAIKLPRGPLWAFAVAASYLSTSFYWQSGYPIPSIAAALCDAIVAYLAYELARERWEVMFGVVFQLMCGVNIIYLPLTSIFGVQDVAHFTVLEALNVASLMIIGGTAFAQMVSQNGLDTLFSPLRNFLSFMRAIRPQNQFYKGPE